MSAPHEREFSDLARYQPMACSSVQAMSTCTFLAMCMPSTKTTRWTSPVTGAIGHTSQNLAHFLLNVLALTLSSSCVLPDSSQDRNSCSSFAVLSILLVDVALQAGHCHLCDPAFVFPYLIMAPSHTGHFFLPISRSIH